MSKLIYEPSEEENMPLEQKIIQHCNVESIPLFFLLAHPYNVYGIT